ncbi:MAG: thioredoxin domain-containing protein, partial [Marmoricola sp.]
MNRLGSATSPYLQQHKDNPVHWWEWSPEAFAEAKARNLPILLSVGYAACHWCHVMAHESFEDEATAAYMNDHYVSIKVDREERPDVDAVYMQATTALTGQGGWPMTCVLDHDGRPFFAGTYFPDRPRHGQPAFSQVLQAISEAWQNRREEIDESAANIAAHLRTEIQAPPAALTEADLDQAVQSLANQFDPMAGGFGAAPKFPPSMVLEFLRRYAYRVGSE